MKSKVRSSTKVESLDMAKDKCYKLDLTVLLSEGSC